MVKFSFVVVFIKFLLLFSFPSVFSYYFIFCYLILGSKVKIVWPFDLTCYIANNFTVQSLDALDLFRYLLYL